MKGEGSDIVKKSNGDVVLPRTAEAPVDEFVQRYQSFKANKSPAIEKEEIQRVFDFFDENKDGFISKEELRHFMNKLGFQTTEEEISSMVSAVDINGDGSVDFNEFASLYRAITEEAAQGLDQCDEEDLREAFHVFDTNNDGLISPTELQAVLMKLGMTEGISLPNCESMIKSVDVDGNGQVDFAEFKRLMNSDFSEAQAHA